MLIRRFLTHFWPLFALSVVLLSGYFLADNQAQIASSEQCQLTSSKCKFDIGNGYLAVEFEQYPIPLEENIQISFSLNGNNDGVKPEIARAWIQGVNMYMGQTQVLLTPNPARTYSTHSSQYSGETFLGSCSEPNMRWQMIVEVTNKKAGAAQKQKPALYFVNFSTQV